jgi:hypothetical protein
MRFEDLKEMYQIENIFENDYEEVKIVKKR